MKLNQVKTGAFLNYIQLILGVIVSIAITPIMLKYLGQSEYGIINLSSSTLAYLSLITLGIGSAFIKFNMQYRVAKDVESERKLNGTFLVIYIIMAIVMAVIGTIIVFSTDFIFGGSMTAAEIHKIKVVMGITLANMVVSLPFSVFTMNINAYEKFVFGKSITILTTVISPMIRLPILLLGGLSISITIATAVLHILACVAQAIYAMKHMKMKFTFGKMNKTMVKAMFAFSAFILMNQVVDMVNWNVGKLILGVISGTAAVAVFSLGATFNAYMLSFSSAINGVLTPQVHRIIASGAPKEELLKLFSKIGRIQFMLISFIMTAFIFFGKSFIVNFYADPSYADSYLTAVLLIVPLIVPLIQGVGITIQHAMNKHKFRSILYLGMAVMNLVISIPLSMKYGSIGAAMGTCVALTIGNGLIMNIYYHKAIGLNMFAFWREIFKFIPALVFPCIVGMIIMLYADTSSLIVFIGYAILYTILYALSLYFVMNKYEKSLVHKPINMVLNKVFKKKKDISENTKVQEIVVDECSALMMKCSGCRACEQVCHTGAITMVENSEGFLYPVIDEDKCTHCGLCDKVCPYKNEKVYNGFETIAFACINNNDEIRTNSSSGGVFFELANLTIANGGVVFGCEMNSKMKVMHSYAEKIEDCKKYRGSKYVQSDVSDMFIYAKQFLKEGREVLFSGTPCQIDGLKLFLNKEYDNLTTVDVVCHGVPSPKVFDKYLQELERKYNSRVVSVNFVDKTYGWNSRAIRVDFANGKHQLKNSYYDKYMKLFLNNISLRPSCHNCSSDGINRKADLSLADFWGVQKKYPEMYDDKGTSLVLINSIKGQQIFENISNSFNFKQVELDFGIQNNPCIIKSVKPHIKREELFAKLDILTINEMTKYVQPKLSIKIKRKLKSIVKKILNKIGLLKLIKR